MKYIFIFLLFLFSNSFYSYGQTNNLQEEINEQVWKPFIHSFNARDEKGFSQVHSKDVVRVNQDNQRILVFNEYFKLNPDNIKPMINEWNRNIELRFTQRIASGMNAFEVGYYKTSNTNTKTGEVRSSFGKFHVLLKKENGSWKILMDADTSVGVEEEMFVNADPLEKK